MMSKLSDLVREYKASPSVKLEKEIIDYIVNVDNPEELDKLHRKVEDEWYKVDNYRLRHLHGGLYAVTESFSMDNGMMCYAYKIDLDEISPFSISAYHSNCPEYRNSVPDDGYFSALAVAMAYDVDNAELCGFARSEAELQLWYDKVDKEVI